MIRVRCISFILSLCGVFSARAKELPTGFIGIDTAEEAKALLQFRIHSVMQDHSVMLHVTNFEPHFHEILEIIEPILEDFGNRAGEDFLH